MPLPIYHASRDRISGIASESFLLSREVGFSLKSMLMHNFEIFAFNIKLFVVTFNAELRRTRIRCFLT